MSRQWYDEDSDRLALEVMAVDDRFPVFRWHKAADGTLILKGTLRSISNRDYQVALVYPADFPETAPRVYPIPRLDGPHTLSDGSMCLFRPDDRTWTSKSTAAVVLAIAALWLSVREHWQRTGVWLGRQHV